MKRPRLFTAARFTLSTGSDCWLLELGLVEYARALELQHRLWELRVAGAIGDVLVLLEHPAVVTVGRNANSTHLLVPEAELERRGIPVCHVERGGDVTFHGPGQLVGYPIFGDVGRGGEVGRSGLGQGLVGVRRLVQMIEAALIRALGLVGIQAGSREGYVGVWVGERKVASIGISVRKRASRHGFALNVNNDLSCFKLMHPCGLPGVQMTSVELEGAKVDMVEMRRAVKLGFDETFGRSFQRSLPRSLTSLTNGLSISAMASA